MGRLQTARLENFIRRWGSIKGPGSVLSETLGDVFPVLDLENLTPESLLPAGWSPVFGQAAVTGVATKLGALQVINPANSGAILVVDKAVLLVTSAQAIAIVRDGTLLTQIIAMANRDSRSRNAFNGTAVIGGSTDTTSPTGGVLINCLANTDREVEFPHALAVLGPGEALQFTTTVAATLLRGSFMCHVRVAEPSELSF